MALETNKSKNNSTSTIKGGLAEKRAKDLLCQEGLKLVEQNFSCKLGEIDLIMLHNDTVVFVEVRSRKSNAFGGAAASVSQSKQKKVLNTAKFYLTAKKIYEKHPVRFDVVAITAGDTQWIQGAFGAN